jgi:hypothetical protein
MKKSLIITLGCLGGILLLLLAGFIALSQPGVQKWLIVGALGKQHSSASISKFSTKGGKIRMEGLELKNLDYTLRLGEFETKGSVLGFLLGKKKEVGHVAIRGFHVGINGNSKTKPDRSLRDLLSPRTSFLVKELVADGELVCKGVHFDLEISGKDLGAGESGELAWEASGRYLGKQMATEGKIRVGYDTTGLLTQFDPEFKIAIQDGPTFGAVTTSEFQDGAEVFDSLVTHSQKDGKKAVKLMEVRLVNQESAGRKELAIKGVMDARTVNQLTLVESATLPEGLQLDLDFQGVMEKGEWLLDRGHLTAIWDGGKLGLQLLQPCKLDPGSFDFTGLSPGSKFMEISSTIPPHWVFPEDYVTGLPLEAKFTLSALPDGFKVNTTKTLLWHALSFKGYNSGKGEYFDISGTPVFTKQGGKYSLQIPDLQVISPDANVLEGSLSANRRGTSTPWEWQTQANVQAYSLEYLLLKSAGRPTFFFRPGEMAKFEAKGEWNGRMASCTSGNLAIASKWTQPWFSAEISQPFRLSKDSGGNWHLDTFGRLAEMKTIGFEPDRIGKAIPGLEFSMSPLTSNWAITNEGGQGLRLGSSGPLSLENFTVSWNGVPYLQRGLMAGVVRLGITPAWELALDDLMLGNPLDPLATGHFAFYDPKLKQPWKGNVTIDLPKASRSVLFKGSQGTVKRGTCHLGIGKSEQNSKTSLQLALRDMELEGHHEAPLDIDIKVKFKDSKEDPFELAFRTLDQGEKSSEGTFLAKGEDYRLDVSSLHLRHIRQVTELANAWGGYGDQKVASDPNKFTPELQFTAKAGKFYLGDGAPLEGMEILVRSSQERFSIEKLSAKSGEGSLEGFAHYRKAISGKEPSLEAVIDSKGIRIENLLLTPSEGKPPSFAGAMDLHATLYAQGGEDLAKLLEGAEIDLNADFKDGHCYFTQLEEKFDAMLGTTDKVQKAGEVVAALPIGKLFGQTAESLANTAQHATNLVGAGGDFLARLLDVPGVKKTLTTIQYDTIHLQAHRDPIGKMRIETMEMRGPVISIDGKGEIGKTQVWKIQDGPLALDLELGVKGVLEGFFGNLGQLAPTSTADGYRLFKANPVQINGTVAKPRLRNLWKVLFPGNYPETPEEEGRKEYDKENTPGVFPDESPLRKAFESGIPFLPF